MFRSRADPSLLLREVFPLFPMLSPCCYYVFNYRVRSPGETEKPRLIVIFPLSRSVQIKRAQVGAPLVAITMPRLPVKLQAEFCRSGRFAPIGARPSCSASAGYCAAAAHMKIVRTCVAGQTKWPSSRAPVALKFSITASCPSLTSMNYRT